MGAPLPLPLPSPPGAATPCLLPVRRVRVRVGASVFPGPSWGAAAGVRGALMPKCPRARMLMGAVHVPPPRPPRVPDPFCGSRCGTTPCCRARGAFPASFPPCALFSSRGVLAGCRRTTTGPRRTCCKAIWTCTRWCVLPRRGPRPHYSRPSPPSGRPRLPQLPCLLPREPQWLNFPPALPCSHCPLWRISGRWFAP